MSSTVAIDPCFLRELKIILACSIISRYRDATGYESGNSRKASFHWFYVANTLTAGVAARQGSNTSAAIFTIFSHIHSIYLILSEYCLSAGRDRVADIFQTIFSSAFCRMENLNFEENFTESVYEISVGLSKLPPRKTRIFTESYTLVPFQDLHLFALLSFANCFLYIS